MNEDTSYKVGDRVLVRPDDGWLQPTRRLAAEGRHATVVNVGVSTFMRGAIKVAFDVKRKGARPHEMFAYPKELMPVEPSSP